MTFSAELEARFAKIVDNYPPGRQKGALIPMLLYAQDEVGAVTPGVVAEVAQRLKVTQVEVDEVIGYYSMLTRKERGKFHIQICTNVSCQARGGAELFEHACKKLGLKNKEKSADGQISIEEVECLGACAWAPALMVNYDFHYQMTPEKFDRLVDSLGGGK
jgi:NADH-quinone oxidoreductase subunit E